MSLIGALTKAAKAGETVKKAAPFYSAVDEAMSNLKRPKGTGIEFLTEVLKQPGVKKAEIADRKLEQAFKAKGKMTKEEAQQVLADNPPPKLKEKVYDESTAIDEADIREAVSQEMYGRPYDDIYKTSEMRRILDEVYKRMDKNLGTTHGEWKTPNGENYREILLKLPSSRPNASNYLDPAKYDADLKAYIASGKKDYTTHHWKDDANVLAHMRVQDRVGPNGEKILHVEEIQSDWHQAGRKKGYGPKLEEQYRAYYTTPDGQQVDIGFGKTPAEVERMTKAAGWDTMPIKIETEKTVRKIGEGVPDAPFKKNWHELAMKRLLNYAADNGYDSIAITPGAEQASRYSLSKHINDLTITRDPDKALGFNIKATDPSGRVVMDENKASLKDLDSYIGKELHDKVLSDFSEKAGNQHSYSGLDLQVGGEGMKGFYDKILPDYLNNYGKSYGAKVEMDSLPVSTRDPKSTAWGGGMRGDHPFMTVQDLNEPFDGMVELMRRNPETGEESLVGRMLRADSERLMAQELQKLDTYNQIKLHNFPITPEMRESIKQKGLPLYQQVGIPTAGAASQALQPEEELGLAGGGSVAKLAALAKLKKLKEEMAPRAEAVQNLMKMDENRYLRDVVPNSLTNESIESEIARMKARAEASQPEVKEAKGGVVRMTKNRDAMFMELSNKKLKRK